jgi:transposase
MDNIQESTLSMAMVTNMHLLANAAITATLPNYSIYFTGVQTGVTQIQVVREQQEFDKTGITVNKNQLKATLIAQSIDVGRRVVAYATVVNNSVLLAETSYTESDLKKSPDTVLKDRCQVIYDRVYIPD